MKKITIPTLYSQWNIKWANKLLGFNTVSTYNIYNYGCLITCLAMVSKYYGFDEDPSDINDKLKSKNGFVQGGLYVWGSITKVHTSIKEKLTRTPTPLTDAQYKEIKDAIDKGYPVMLQIDVNPKTVALDMHYVLCIGYNPQDENDLLIADPLGGKERSLKDYLGWFRPNMRRTIEQYVIYEGKVLQTGDKLRDTVIDFDDSEGKRHNVGWYVYEWFVEKTARLKCEETATKEIEETRQELKKVNELLDEAHETITKKETVITEKNDIITGHLQTIKEQKDLIEILKTQTLDNLTIGEVVMLLWEAVKDLKFKK